MSFNTHSEFYLLGQYFFPDNDVIMNDLKYRKIHFFFIFFGIFRVKT